ncbi:MAG: hypothetical protein R2710_04285 [Acidimicrobiales bacterium]
MTCSDLTPSSAEVHSCRFADRALDALLHLDLTLVDQPPASHWSNASNTSAPASTPSRPASPAPSPNAGLHTIDAHTPPPPTSPITPG